MNEISRIKDTKTVLLPVSINLFDAFIVLYSLKKEEGEGIISI